jgi:hypothetical protein
VWNKKGENIMVFLSERCTSLAQESTALSQQMLTQPPAVENLADFVLRLSRVREQLPRCEALRNRLSLARLSNRSLPEVLSEALEQMDKDCSAYFGMASIEDMSQTHYAGVAVGVLTELQTELADFRDERPATLNKSLSF